jgi:signal transduction histidine kinase
MNNSWAWPVLIVLAVASATASASASEETKGFRIEHLVRFLSPEYRRIEKRIGQISTELESLPSPKKEAWGSRYGHRSADLQSPAQPDWLQLDFGEKRLIDTVVLVPAAVGYGENVQHGFGFPKRFKVQLADNPEMEGAVTVVEQTDEDVVNPGLHPVVIPIPPTEGRYLRFTSLKHHAGEESFFWAMEEIMALEGNINVALEASDTRSSYTSLFPLWAPLRAFNGQSRLGMPVDVTDKSPSTGYLSARQPLASQQTLSESDFQKWCGVDLGRVCRIEQIRMCPLESDEYMVFGGRGFPRSFRIELALDENFQQVVWNTVASGLPLGYPSGWALIRPVPDVEARYVRIVATRMWARDDTCSFGLSELQVYGEGRNLALGKPVLFKDKAGELSDSAWAPEYLVDGYTSHYRLIEWPEYLDRLEKRALLENELADLLAARNAALVAGSKIFFMASGFLLFAMVGVVAWILIRQRVEQHRALQRLREQISRDLHDDIGSNLGGIILLSEAGGELSTDREIKRDFEAIRDAAEQASSSMRDIVWLIQREDAGLKEMIIRMREAADLLLSRAELDFTVEPVSPADRKLSLFFRRHTFLAFKEVLNNIRKHARAQRVTIRLEIDRHRLRFEVKDDGIGFDPRERLLSGYGLGNIKRRAERLGGRVHTESSPGSGTAVTFEAPFSS